MEIRDALLSSSSRFHLVVPPVVCQEFQNNLPKVVEETKMALEKLFSDQEHAQTTLDILLEREPTIQVASTAERLVELCENLACLFLAHAVVEPTNADDYQRAFARSIGRRAPAKQGKDSLGDCLITEFALRFAKHFSATGQYDSIALVSSNTTDYCNGRRLVPALQAEFDDAGLRYCRNWVEALHSVHQN